MMTNYDKERLAILEYERDNAIKHKCPRVAAARQREIDKIMNRFEKFSESGLLRAKDI